MFIQRNCSTNMLKYSFKTYVIFLLNVIIQVNHGISNEHATEEAATLSDTETRKKCTSDYCTCTDIPRWDDVDCEPDSWSTFPILNFRGFKYLPERMFQGLSIHEINLSDPEVTVAENFLEGILRLEKFAVYQSSIKVVPDFKFTKDSIKYVEIESSGLTSLDGKYLQNLTSVSVLSFFNNSIRYIDPDVFWGTYNVQRLDLSHNKLTSVPPKLLDPMTKLEYFYADHNNLLHVDHLFSVTQRLFINLAFNNITNFSLTELFNAKKSELIYGYHVYKLDLSYNFIKETSKSLSTCYFNHESMIKIFRLNLNGNEILRLNGFLRCSQLKILQIIGNSIQSLTEKDFTSVLITGELHLRDNQIRQIDTDTFKPFKTSLQEMDLSSNKIISINGSIKYLSSLRILNISYNSIQAFAEDEFSGLDSLILLYLQNNQIKSLEMTLEKLEVLYILNIAHNDIKLIKPDQLPNNLSYIYIAGNTLKCDCNLLPLINMMKDYKKKGGCLRSELENSLRNHLNCPDMCSCKCTEYGGVFSMFVDCSSRNLSRVLLFSENNLAQLEVAEISLSDDRLYHVMYQNIDPSLHLEDKVLGISLENNSLDVLDAAQLPPNLVQLYLSDNRLKRFPQHVIDTQLNLKEVSLSGNPWTCDCDALKFKKWLTFNNHIIKDFDNVRCGMGDKGEKNLNGSVIWKLNDADICPTTDFVWIALVASLSLATFCLFIKVLYSKYELNIKVTLYSHGIFFVKEEVSDHDKAFDAFISFSHNDDEFVIKDIISEIENIDPNIRLCLHYRHFRPGVPIIDNITHAVQKSKRTVLILSRNFFESEWCFLEFQTAYKQSLLDKVHRVIAIKVGELPTKIDPTIKFYLNSTTYLTWGESNFWKKLLYVLPCRNSETSPFLRFVGDDDSVFNFPSSNLLNSA